MKKLTSEYLNINRVEIAVTFRCTGKCRHCLMGDDVNSKKYPASILPDKAAEAVEKLSGLFNLESVMTWGGEPLLYPDVVCAIHSKAAECKVGVRELITNGYFSNDRNKIRDAALLLSEAGVNNLFLSVDALHQETIPEEPVYRFACELVAAGIQGCYLHPAWLVDKDHDNSYNKKTKELLAKFSGTGIPAGKGNNLSMTGYAVDNFSDFYEKPSLDLTKPCSSLTDVTSININPDGEVYICGFSIGNIYREDIADIVSRYYPHRDEYMKAVITGGVDALLECAKQNGVDVDVSRFYSACDVCHFAGKGIAG